MLRSISWFYIRLAFDVDSGLYLKLEQTDFPEYRFRHADGWCWDGFQFNVTTRYDGDDYTL
jgi:hypothetical protein